MTSVIRGSDNFDTNPATRSRVSVRTTNGVGSVNTAVRRWLTLLENIGADITYADSATLGASFTINTPGIYAISYSDQYNSAATAVISDTNTRLNTTCDATDILAAGTSAAANFTAHCGWTGYIAAGTVIRARGYGANPISGTLTAVERFSIVRVG